MRKIVAAALALPLLAVTARSAAAQNDEALAGIGAAELQAAMAAMRSASVVVFGDTVRSSRSWVAYYVANNPVHYQQVRAGELNYTSAVDYLKTFEAETPSRYAALNRVMHEVWGRDALGAEIQQYGPQLQAGQTWYVIMRTAELQRLSDEYLRRQAIERGYLNSLGRVPSAAELAYWMPRRPTYLAVYRGNMEYVFHPSHRAELKATAARALAVSVLHFSEQDIDSVAAMALTQHRDYNGMVHWLAERH